MKHAYVVFIPPKMGILMTRYKDILLRMNCQ